MEFWSRFRRLQS